MEKLAMLKTALLGKHEVRKTYAQKTAFIDWARDYASSLGREMQVEESGKLVRTRNLIFGDVGTARTLITAHYDTCARLPVPNFMTPACWPVIILTQGVLPMLLFALMGFCVGFLSVDVLPAVMPAWAAGISSFLFAFVIVGVVIGLMLFGPANPHTANDNTSGVAAVLRLLPEFAGRKDVAFVLFDNEEIGLLGASAFVKAHRSLLKQAFVVNLDCVSDGDMLLYAATKAANRCPQAKRIGEALDAIAPKFGKRAMTGESPKVFYPSDQMVFAKGTAFAALKGKHILYLDRIHTAKDTVFDDGNLLCLLEVLIKAI